MTDRGSCPNEQINIVELQTRVLALSCQRPPAPPDVSAAAVSAHQCDFKRVIVSVFSLGGPHIKVQFQALHLMVMALPDANRDTAQVSDIDLGTYHGAHLGKIGVGGSQSPCEMQFHCLACSRYCYAEEGTKKGSSRTLFEH